MVVRLSLADNLSEDRKHVHTFSPLTVMQVIV